VVAVTEESIDNTEKKRLDQLSGAARRRIAMQSTTEEEEEEEVEEFIQNRTHAGARFLTGEGEGAGGGGKFI
jgi:hypothetical protein